jgi:hypothetical protein
MRLRRGRFATLVPAVVLAVGLGLGSSSSVALGSRAGRSSTSLSAKAVESAKLVWTRSPAGAPGAGNLNGIASGGKLFVVVGLVGGGQPGAVPIWTSSDGLKWRVAKGPAAAFPGGTVLTDVVYDGKRFLAFGQPQSGTGTLAWASSDGRTWKSYQPAGFPVSAAEIPIAATPTKGGLLLLVADPSTNIYSLWSARGDRWESVGPVPGAGLSNVFLARAVPAPSAGGFVAVGQQSRDATAWTSSDGSQWSQVSVSDDPEGFESIQGVVAAGPGLVAVGVANGPTGSEIAYAWTSTDGAQWQPASGGLPEFVGESGAGLGMDTATLNGEAVLAAGHEGGALAFWTSPNGTSWKRVPDDPQFQVRSGTAADATGVVAASGRIVAIFRERRLSGTRFQTVGLGIVAGKAR